MHLNFLEGNLRVFSLTTASTALCTAGETLDFSAAAACHARGGNVVAAGRTLEADAIAQLFRV